MKLIHESNYGVVSPPLMRNISGEALFSYLLSVSPDNSWGSAYAIGLFLKDLGIKVLKLQPLIISILTPGEYRYSVLLEKTFDREKQTYSYSIQGIIK